MKRATLVFSMLLLSGSLAASVTPISSAHAAEAVETISATDWDNARYHVAQVVENESINISAATAQLTTVYRGGIVAPFGALLSVWDPIPQDGGDFGTVKTFDLGNFASVLRLESQALRINSDGETVIELTLSGLLPDAELTGNESFNFLVTIKIRNGEVQDSVRLKRMK